MATLISRADYKTSRRLSSTTAQDGQIDLALAAASDAIRRYTDRDFGTTLATSTRQYWYEGSGVLEIDDCAVITAVVIGGRTLVANTSYIAQPQNEDAFFWIELGAGLTTSPAMGFERNEDTYTGNALLARRSLVSVTASFGWVNVPASVQQACTWLADQFIESSHGGGLQSESIADLSQVYAASIATNSDVITPRIQQLLDPFKRLSV